MTKKRIPWLIWVLSIMPYVLYVAVYARDSLLHIVAAVSFIIVALYAYWRHQQNQKIRLLSPITFLIASFYLIAFYHLGSMHAPKQFEILTSASKPVHFIFEKPQRFTKICYYVGIDKNVQFSLSQQKQSGELKRFYTRKGNYPFSFSWHCVTAGIRTDQVVLTMHKNKMMLGEVRFFHGDKMIPYQSEREKLDDEPESIVDDTYMGSMYFDEIYHGRTAYEIMQGIGVYENAHPYLGKMLLIPGIKMFGMTPFGWRFVNVLFAGMMILLIYQIGRRLFGEEYLAFGAALMLTYSFMHFTQSRMAHIDTFGVFFVLCSYYFLLLFIQEQKLSNLFLSGVFFGLASAVKWSALFSVLGFVAIFVFLIVRQHPLLKRYSFVKLLFYGLYAYGVIAGVVYLLSFWEILKEPHGLKAVIDYNLNMYHYHSTLKATHPYSSPWWSWLLDMKPMSYYRQIHGTTISTINAMVNPAIAWMGLIAIAYLCYRLLRRSNLEGALILFALCGLLLPYALVGRLMFIYHLYYALPFVILAVVYMFKDVTDSSVRYVVFGGYLVVVVVLFLMFYPILSGYEIDRSYVSHWLRWFDHWWF